MCNTYCQDIIRSYNILVLAIMVNIVFSTDPNIKTVEIAFKARFMRICGQNVWQLRDVSHMMIF